MIPQLPRVHLDIGGHNFDNPYGCLMEWVSILNGESKNYSPRCTNEVITSAAVALNDVLDEEPRQRLVPFIPRLLNARRTSRDREINRRLRGWVLVNTSKDDLESASAMYGSGTSRSANPNCDECRVTTTNILDCDDCCESCERYHAQQLLGSVAHALGASMEIEEVILWFSDLLDAHDKARADEGVLLEEEFCAFTEEQAAS